MIVYAWDVITSMEKIIKEYSGRSFTAADLDLIVQICHQYKKLSRLELAATVCELIDWTTARGLPKKSQCQKFLEELEAEGLLELPVVRRQKHKPAKADLSLAPEGQPRQGEVGDFAPIRLHQAEAGKDLPIWRAYVQRYHMLGDRKFFGASIYYFIMSGEEIFGCLSFSASAWALKERDSWIGWDQAQKKERLHLIANNSRFLILPWIKVHNLASHVLGLVSRQIQKDWLERYCYAPVLLETFVDLDHFTGSSYKAANWLLLGKTQGRGREDREKAYAKSIKAIFMYPLQKDWQSVLLGEKEPPMTEAHI